MLVDYVAFLVIEDKTGNSREKHRVSIHLLNAETGCRIVSVGAGQANVKDSSKFILMGRDPGKD